MEEKRAPNRVARVEWNRVAAVWRLSAINRSVKAFHRRQGAKFRRLFRGRTDVYPVRWESKTTGESDDPVRHPDWTALLDRDKDALTEFGARRSEKITSRRDCVIAVKGRESDRKRDAR